MTFSLVKITWSSPIRFDQMFSSVLEQLQPVCVAEQKFLTSFFHFQKPSAEEEGSGSQVCVHLISLTQPLTATHCRRRWTREMKLWTSPSGDPLNHRCCRTFTM